MIYLERSTFWKPDFHAVGCFVECGGKILQLLRANNKKVEPCKWGAPAGSVNADLDENAVNAMLRELFEETGLRVFARQFHKVCTVFVAYPKACFDYTIFWLCFPFTPEIRLSS